MASITASSALVNVVDGAELCLVRLLAESSAPGSIRPAFVQDCETCIAHSDATQLIQTIVSEQGAIAALVSLDDEAVSAISLLAACLDRVQPPNSANMLIQLADSIIAISAASSGATTKAISLLATLYNMRSNPTEKVALLVKMIRLAASDSGGLLEADNSVLGKWMDPAQLTKMLDEWKVPPAGRRELFRAAADGSQKSSNASQQFTLLVAETYSNADIDASGFEAAKQAAIGAIRDPVSLFVQQRKILSLPAIQALETSEGACLFRCIALIGFFLADIHNCSKLSRCVSNRVYIFSCHSLCSTIVCTFEGLSRGEIRRLSFVHPVQGWRFCPCPMGIVGRRLFSAHADFESLQSCGRTRGNPLRGRGRYAADGYRRR
jgi:hypothetical protein